MRIVNLSKHFVNTVSDTMFWCQTDDRTMTNITMCLMSEDNCREYTQQNDLQQFLSNHYQWYSDVTQCFVQDCTQLRLWVSIILYEAVIEQIWMTYNIHRK